MELERKTNVYVHIAQQTSAFQTHTPSQNLKALIMFKEKIADLVYTVGYFHFFVWGGLGENNYIKM